MKQVRLNPYIVLRSESHLDAYFAFNTTTCESHHFDAGSYEIFNHLNQARSIQDLYISFPDYEQSSIDELIHFGLNNNIITHSFSTDSNYIPTSTEKLTPSHIAPSAPYQLDIFLTNMCNLRCKHCYANAGIPYQDELNGDEWISLFDQLEQMSLLKVLIGGGEPYMHPDIDRIIDHLGTNRYIKCLISNGTLLTKNRT